METAQLKGFNVRIYGLCILNNKLLSLNELFAGKVVTKLPGGGLELGEGTAACLKREFKEELNVEIEINTPFYIQESFTTSLANDQKQILMLYFTVTILDMENLKIQDQAILGINWIELTDHNPFTLPIDRLVFEKLQKQNCKN